jgi:hypothetical protein
MQGKCESAKVLRDKRSRAYNAGPKRAGAVARQRKVPAPRPLVPLEIGGWASAVSRNQKIIRHRAKLPEPRPLIPLEIAWLLYWPERPV